VCTGLSGAPYDSGASLALGRASTPQKPESNELKNGILAITLDCPVCYQLNGYLSELAIGFDRWHTGSAPDCPVRPCAANPGNG
jgi:hypothetical protein